jgi:hypothetical protein
MGEEIPVSQSFYHRQLPTSTDVFMGVVKIPLQQLLFSHTGNYKLVVFIDEFSICLLYDFLRFSTC